eukprot:2865813-Pyramimonas_sp.AAC.1
MPRDQQQFDALFERMKSYAHIAERDPGNSGGIFIHGRRSETFHVEANAGQPANNVWSDEPQSTETTTLLAQNGRAASGSQGSRARLRGSPGAVSPMQAVALIGSAGQHAEADFDLVLRPIRFDMMKPQPLTTRICPHTLRESNKRNCYFLGCQNYKRRWRSFMKEPVRNCLLYTSDAADDTPC